MDPVYLGLAAASMGVLVWRHLRRARRRPHKLASGFDGDAEVVLHVAEHEAKTRGHALSSLHVLYGLLQDETIASAIRDAGADPSALEDEVQAALDGAHAHDVEHLYAYATTVARQGGRSATPTDLWAFYRGVGGAAVVGDELHARVLFRLCHRGEPGLPQGTADVLVVLRNDDYTTQEFVCDVLVKVIGLGEPDALARMMETHTEGRAVLGRFPATDARTKIAAVRARALERGYPLWIGVEPT